MAGRWVIHPVVKAIGPLLRLRDDATILPVLCLCLCTIKRKLEPMPAVWRCR
jgi:hypothetical protein